MKFHIAHFVPHPRMHGLYGYMEVIQSIEWGLRSLGYSVTYGLNSIDDNSTNIVFGAQVLPINILETLPENTIIYHLEQIRGASKELIRKEAHYFADRFRIWDYSASNIETWKALNAKDVKVVPVGYAPVLTRISKPDIQDIDVLIYGSTGQKRLETFHYLTKAGFSVIYASGLYGQSRDGLIQRSKIILNVNLYDITQIFEIVRVSYLLANRKAVISTLDKNTYIDPEFKDAVKFSLPEQVIESVNSLLEKNDERTELENHGFNVFSKIDIRDILQKALSA